jgi:hypothetical protein
MPQFFKGAGMTQSKTERAKYVFAVKEFGDGTPWVKQERSGNGLEVLGNGFIGLELTEGTSFQEAEALAAILRRNVSAVAYTNFLP